MTRSKSPEPRHRLRRGAYLLPSVFTIGNILLGFYAITLGLGGSFQHAAVMIFIAGILDALDGRIARLSGTASDFGREFDSLADVLTFGATPALLSYLWGLKDLGRIGWLVPLFFLVCSATRLARFNVQTRVVDSRFFVGLPAPAAAAGIVSILFFAPDHQWRAWVTALLVVALLSLGGLMVSTFRYRSFKRVDLKRRWSYRAALPLALVLLVIAYHPPAAFFVVAALYTLSGPIAWLWGYLRRQGGGSSPQDAPHSREAES